MNEFDDLEYSLVGACCLFLPARAEDVEKKFRIGLGVGFLNAQSSISSDSANTLTLVDAGLEPVDFFRDPRNDSAAFGNLDIKSGALGTVFGQYAVNKIFLIELSVGYQKPISGISRFRHSFRVSRSLISNASDSRSFDSTQAKWNRFRYSSAS